MTRRVLIAAALVGSILIIEAYGEATSPKAPTSTLSGTPLNGVGIPARRSPASWSRQGGVPTPAVRRTAVVGALVAAQRTVTGDANFADPIHGSAYLAMRLDRGTPVTITGAGGTWTTRTTDYGPAEWTGDIADIALVRFAEVCNFTIAEARRRGECRVTVAAGLAVAARPTLPATDR